MRNLYFRFGLNKTSWLKLTLLLSGAAVFFSCNSVKPKENGSLLFPSAAYKEKTISLSLPDWEGDYIYYRGAESGNLLAWKYPDYQLKMLNYPKGQVVRSLDIGSLFSYSGIDFLNHGDSLLITGSDSEIGIFDWANQSTTEIMIDSSVCGEERTRTYTTKDFLPFFEGGQIYLHASNSYGGYMTDFEEQKKFFSCPIEVSYNLKTKESKCFGSYPFQYQTKEMDFYDWMPHRQRFNGNSIYSFPVIDSLYIYNSKTGSQHAIECKSALDTRSFIPFDKSRYMDYSYIYEHLLSNGRNYGLVADPYRNLLYSIFITGNDPPANRRLKYSDVAFTVMIFDDNLGFEKEVYFPPGQYNPGRYFITPEGLAFQTASSDVAPTRVFDVFDFTKDAKPLNEMPMDLVYTSQFVPLREYLRDSLSVPAGIDSVVVISGLGCTGCLENFVLKAEARGANLDEYGYVITQEASRSLTIQNFAKRRKYVWVEETAELGSYKAIGDFLTLIVLQDDTTLVDDKFSF